MNKFLLLLLIVTGACSLPSSAQFSRYIVKLKNKTGTPYNISNPSQFLTQRSISRRTRYNIPVDATDLPVTPRYIDSIRLAGTVTVLSWSKWLNQVCIRTSDDAALARISAFPFVESTSAIAAKQKTSSTKLEDSSEEIDLTVSSRPSTAQNVTGYYDYGSAYTQIHLHNTEFLHNYGLRGQNMQICVTDDGFFNYQTLPTFDSVRNNNQILGTWDFVTNDASVNEDDAHGMKCFSTIAANMPGSFVGTAPQASYYLYRTEDIATEYPVEEHNWAVAAERADSLGVDVLSVSLGYTAFDNALFNHTYSDLTGNKTMIVQAINLAAKKGMLVVVAAGNDGNTSWHYIATPGDADSALTVGAVNSNRLVGSFSGYGPNADGQIKPDVAAIGNPAVIANSNTGIPVTGSGTSYACPVMAGTATCLWQAFPEINNFRLMDALRQSADRYQNPDDRSGYGIPDVKVAFVKLIQELHHFSGSFNSCTASINTTVKAGDGMSVQVERKLPSDAGYQTVFTQIFSGSFSSRSIIFRDTLSSFTSGVNIAYRIKMNIGTDTSFFLDSALLMYTTQCAAITEQKICPSSRSWLSVNAIAGYSNQWQVNTGSGFTAISDNAFYSGTASNVLLMNNLPANFYGYQYRCVQTSGNSVISSTPVTIKFTSSWTGAASNAWEDANNWTCGIVPNAFIDAVIQPGVPHFPVVGSNAVCHSLSNNAGASVLVKTGFQLAITGQ